MRAKTKTFDCVEMKNRIQAEIMAEFDSETSGSASFIEHIHARAAKSEFIRSLRKRFPRAGRTELK